MHQRWLSLPLLTSCVSAFYPYSGQDAGDHNKRFIPFSQPEEPQGDSGLLKLDLKKGPV
jgi:hypothetical protein